VALQAAAASTAAAAPVADVVLSMPLPVADAHVLAAASAHHEVDSAQAQAQLLS
jgi:hypothetical protein